MKHSDLYQLTQNRIKYAFPLKISGLERVSHVDLYSYIVFDTASLHQEDTEYKVEIARISATWKFMGRDSGVENIDIPPQFAEILLQKKHKSNIITCVAVERYMYAGRPRECASDYERILYQLLVSTDQFLYGKWWKGKMSTNKIIRTNNLVYIGQQLIDAEDGEYI